jgi:hypothetical protein
MVTFVHRVCEIGNDSFSLVFTNTILNLQQYVPAENVVQVTFFA